GFTFNEAHPNGNYEIVGNIFHGYPGSTKCDIKHGWGLPKADWDIKQYNMATQGGTTCGPTNLRGSARYVNGGDGRSGPPDYRLRSGSPGIAKGPIAARPLRDLEGNLRPRRWRSDVGAYQHESAQIALGRSIGGARIGMSRSQVQSRFGVARRLARQRTSAGAVVAATYRRPGGKVTVYYRGNVVVGVKTSTSYYATAAGLGVGSTARSLPRAARLLCEGVYELRRGATATRFLLERPTSGVITSLAIWRAKYRTEC
ncbi:MAG TPA: hypothetical protein VMM36_09435, partial [Opitutaceae bacterium]|nr:hypothetical protein [Opitutaceae bacterium]